MWWKSGENEFKKDIVKICKQNYVTQISVLVTPKWNGIEENGNTKRKIVLYQCFLMNEPSILFLFFYVWNILNL